MSRCLEREKDLFYDAEEIWDDLSERGFSEEDIEFALGHIEKTALILPGLYNSGCSPVLRSYSAEEMTRLSPKARGYLWKLKLRGVIDHAIEDEIVQKAMDLEEPATLREIKTVAALTVFGYEHKIQRQHRYLSTETHLH